MWISHLSFDIVVGFFSLLLSFFWSSKSLGDRFIKTLLFLVAMWAVYNVLMLTGHLVKL
jgi:hypothetical protein